MGTTDQSREVPKAVLVDVVVFIWFAAVALYWLVEPGSTRHTLASIILSYLVLWGVVFLWSNASKTETAKRFFLTSVSVTLIVGFLELLVLSKVVDFRFALGTARIEPWHHPDNLLDPKLLHIRKPYHRFFWEGIEYRYDQHGLRNESDLEAADIVVIGDSFIEGWGVSATDLITSHLAKQLDRTVANLGQSWYGPQQELELLRRYGLPLRPKVCVWVFFEGNDLVDVHRYNNATRDWENFSKNLHSFRQRSFTKNFLLAVRRLLDSVHRRTTDNVARKNRSGIFEESSGRKARIHFPAPGLHLSSADHEALEQFRLIIIQAYHLCGTVGARFLVLFAPNKFRVYKSFTEFDTDTWPRYWVINDLPKRLEAIVREGLPDGEFMDLTSTLAEEAEDGLLVYFPGWDTHWSLEGHRVAAAAIAHFLRRSEENEVSVSGR